MAIDKGRSNRTFQVASILLAALLLGLVLSLAGTRPAWALPSYARQTGQQCAACHNGFPELTPYGRLFKLNAYTFTGGTLQGVPPLAMMMIPNFTHTAKGQPGGAAPNFGPNDNFAFRSERLHLYRRHAARSAAACNDDDSEFHAYRERPTGRGGPEFRTQRQFRLYRQPVLWRQDRRSPRRVYSGHLRSGSEYLPLG